MNLKIITEQKKQERWEQERNKEEGNQQRWNNGKEKEDVRVSIINKDKNGMIEQELRQEINKKIKMQKL